MSYKLRPIQTGLLACVLAIAIFVPEAIAAQALNYNVTSGTRTIAAGSPGASLSARVGNSSSSLNFSLCFTTGYGSSAPITPDSPSFSSGYTTVTLAVPAPTIQQVPPAAFTNGVFSASLYAVPVSATSCTGPSPSTAAKINLIYPHLAAISLTSVPQSNPNLSTRLPANVTLTGSSFLRPNPGVTGTSSSVAFSSDTDPGVSYVGTVRPVSASSLVSSIPTSIPASVPSVKVQVCNSTALYSYCSNTLDLALAPLATDVGKVATDPSVALPTQNVTVSATFGSAKASLAGAPGGLVTFSDGQINLGTAPLTLDASGRFLHPACVVFRGSTPAARPLLADFNQDGVPDVLILDTAANLLNLALGSSPAASFQYVKTIGPPQQGAAMLDATVADFNGDGFPDIAILANLAGSSSNNIYLLLNDGSGNFTAPAIAFANIFASHILAADFNHDGLADVTIAGALDAAGTTGLQVLLGDGAGHLTAGPASAGLRTSASPSFGGFQIAVTDLNGDGFPDIAVLNGANASDSQVTKSIVIFQNDGTGNFAAAATVTTDGTASAAFEAAPLAPHQLPAFLITSSTGLSVALNQSAATIAFSSSLPFTSIAGLKKAVFGDFNGDGLLDAAVDDGTTVHVLTGDGRGSFAATYRNLSIPSFSNFAVFSAGDVNGDTYADLVMIGLANGLYTLQGYVTAGTASASISSPNLATGVHTISASTPGTFYFEGASATTTLTIDIPTTVSVTSSAPSAVPYGQPVTLSATIPDPTATGTVSFFNGTKLLGSAPVVDSTSATAQFITTTLPAGKYAVKAVYSGDAAHAGATSPPVSFLVLQTSPTIVWPAPASIIAGTPLSNIQLDASAVGVNGTALQGNFTYTPPAGTVEQAGAQVLNVVFTPTDVTDYTTASASTSLTVVPFTVSGLSSDLAILGDPAKTITISGTGFFPTAVVLMNGTPVPTSYVSSTAITAVLPASDFLHVGTLQVTVSDSAQSAISQPLPFYVVAPIADVIFTGPTSIVPGTQVALTFELTNPYPVPLTATFSLSFEPASGLPNDPNVLFSSGANTYTVVIPADSTVSPQVLIQAGTIAGTLTVGLDLMAGGTDVTPASVHPLNIQAPVSAPGITSVSSAASGKTLTVSVHGFSNTREVKTATFHFTPVPGHTLSASDVTIDVSAIFAAWYADPASDQYGSAFTYSQVFNLTSEASVVGQVTVTLANSAGTSSPASSQ